MNRNGNAAKPRRSWHWFAFIGGAVVAVAALAAGYWWRYQTRFQRTEEPPPSPVLVFLLSPSIGDEVDAGDFVQVTLQAVAPTAIVSAELFVDGQSQGVVTELPEIAAWAWQAYPVGIHTLTAKATAADGQVGESQTVIVNVLEGDGVMQVFAGEGQTLEEIGAGFGAPPDQMASANPMVDASQPIAAGQPVLVPVPEEGPSGEPARLAQLLHGTGGPPSIPIAWDITFAEGTDRSYCYVSSGNGVWERMPKRPFDFFRGAESSYTQLIPAVPNVLIQVDCWGWAGDSLRYLGQGETGFDLRQPPANVAINGNGFRFGAAIPKLELQPLSVGGDEILAIPPVFALRFAKDAAECISHANPGLDPSVCENYVNALGYNVLVWEWEPRFDKPDLGMPDWDLGDTWLNDIDGYEAAQGGKIWEFIHDPSQKMAVVPIAFGEGCYAVTAYADPGDYPGYSTASVWASLCPGDAPELEKITLSPTDWLTAGGLWTDVGDCGVVETGAADRYENQWAQRPGEVVVGSDHVQRKVGGCHRVLEYEGAVEFDISQLSQSLPAGAVVQQAVLKYSVDTTDYFGAGWPTSVCTSSIGKATQDWTGLGVNHFFPYPNVLSTPAYFAPIASTGWNQKEISVTAVVKAWLKNLAFPTRGFPSTHHGFILTPASAPDPSVPPEMYDIYVYGICVSGLNDFRLDVYYYAPS